MFLAMPLMTTPRQDAEIVLWCLTGGYHPHHEEELGSDEHHCLLPYAIYAF